MSKESIKKGLIVLGSAALWLVLDLTTKKIAVSTLSSRFSPPSYFKGWIGLTFQKNNGVAFGLPLNYPILIATSVLLILLLIGIGIQVLRESQKYTLLKSLLIGMTLGGAMGNFWSRLKEGSVVDFLVLRPIPTFNVADIGITVGLLVLAVLSLQKSN